MSFSPYSAMITVCVCFNSRVQLTVPSFTAWLRSRYSKALFIVLRWPAQEKDKGVCQGCHHVKKWAGWAVLPGNTAASAPCAGPLLLQARPTSILLRELLGPLGEAALGVGHSTDDPQVPGLRSHRPELEFCFCYCLVECGLGFNLLIWKMGVLIPSSQEYSDIWDIRGVDKC